MSLWEYVNSADAAAELHVSNSSVTNTGCNCDCNCDCERVANDAAITLSPHYALLVSPDHFRSIMAARTDRKHVTSLVRELVSGVVSEAAAELARVFEYQLALLGDGLAGVMLAKHAALCVMDYVIYGGRYLEQDTVVTGAVRGQSRQVNSAGLTPTVSVIVGERELKWRLDEILKKAGLRMEMSVCSDNEFEVSIHNSASSPLL